MRQMAFNLSKQHTRQARMRGKQSWHNELKRGAVCSTALVQRSCEELRAVALVNQHVLREKSCAPVVQME